MNVSTTNIKTYGGKLCLIFRKNHLKEGNQNTFGVYATNNSSVYTSTNAVRILWQNRILEINIL